MLILKIIIWLVLIALSVAKLEIEIEGKEGGGWARHLPTKRISNCITHWLFKKEITFYHIYLISTLFVVFHGMFIFIPWTIKSESMVLGLFVAFFILEDFLWFICNPYYGIKKFRKGKISWHKRWIFGLPVSYIWGVLLSMLLMILGLK